MARNRIQFQKGSLSRPVSRPCTVARRGAARRSRAGAGRRASSVRSAVGASTACFPIAASTSATPAAVETSLTAGTILNSTKVTLTTWFRAMYLITQTKQGISSIELGRRLGVTQTTAWKIKTKLAEVMRVAGESERLDGRIEMDDAYLGGQRSGGKTGRGSPGKKPIVVAVQASEDGRPRRIKLRRIARFKRKRVKSIAKKIIAEGATVVTDGLKCFRGVADAGCRHVAMATGSGRKAARHPAFKWVNTMLGNIKISIAGTYRAIRKKHMVRYLAEFEWRFNHRFDLAGMIPALARAAAQSKPVTYGQLKVD